MTQAERIARIEVHLEGLPHIHEELKAMRGDINRMRGDITAHKNELANIKNRGVGIMLGVALAASFFGAKVSGLFAGLLGLFK